jgi:Zn-dependent membrane protease YugP
VDLWFYIVAGLTWLFSSVVRSRLMATYGKYARVPNRAGLTGADVARAMLDSSGLQDVPLELAPGRLTDHYDPRTRSIRLSAENARSTSIAAMAVSAHEAAHAIQDAVDYAPLELRTQVFPLVQAASRFGLPLAIMGSLLGIPALVPIGVFAYLAATAFQFITLPVEINASKRALAKLKELGLTRGEEEERQAKETLRAAAMTYVASAASAAGFVLLMGLNVARAMRGGRGGRA